MTNNKRNLITRAEAARRAGVSPQSINYWFTKGKLIKYKDGLGHVYVDADALEKLITPVAVASGA